MYLQTFWEFFVFNESENQWFYSCHGATKSSTDVVKVEILVFRVSYYSSWISDEW